MKKSVDPVSPGVKARWKEIFEKASAAYKAAQELNFAPGEDLKVPVKLKVSLKGLPHQCERVLLLPPDITMRQLHFFIQRSMGWRNTHLFDFSDSVKLPSISVGMVLENSKDSYPPTFDAHTMKLIPDFLTEVDGQAFYYLYGFGDFWEHKITILEPTKKELEEYSGYPTCLSAVGKCPPEEVGSASGYQDFLERVNDPSQPAYKDYRRWAGLEMKGVYDPFEVDLTYINYRLVNFFLSQKYNKDTCKLSHPRQSR